MMQCDYPTFYNPQTNTYECRVCGFLHSPSVSTTLAQNGGGLMSDTATAVTLESLPYAEIVGFGKTLTDANIFATPLQLQSYYTTPTLYDYAYSNWMENGQPGIGSDNWQGFVDFLTNYSGGIEADPAD